MAVCRALRRAVAFSSSLLPQWSIKRRYERVARKGLGKEVGILGRRGRAPPITQHSSKREKGRVCLAIGRKPWASFSTAIHPAPKGAL